MKHNKKSYMTALIAVVCVAPAVAQVSDSGYFLDNYYYGYQLNPAFGNRHSYVSMPAVGNVNAAANGNINTTDILYKGTNGKTWLFTNPNIPAGEALSKFSDVNRINAGVNLGIISGGWSAWGGYNNISISAKAGAHVGLPKSIFSLIKEGVSNKTYDITDLKARAFGYAEIALNHSRDIKPVPGLRAGVSAKFLLPVAYAEANFNRLELELGENSWNARADAEMKVALDGSRFEYDYNETTGMQYVDGLNTDDIKYGPNGFGFAVDLGASYEWRDFVFSLALTDLGAMSFNNVQTAASNRYFQSDAYTIAIGDDGDSWDRMKDNFMELYQLQDKGNDGSSTVGLDGMLRAGVDYRFLFYDRLHFGLLYTNSLSGSYPLTEFRVSANVEPIKGIAASLNASAGTYGASWGWLLSLGNKGFNFMLGMDYANYKFGKDMVPLNSNVDFHMGINFPF